MTHPHRRVALFGAAFGLLLGFSLLIGNTSSPTGFAIAPMAKPLSVPIAVFLVSATALGCAIVAVFVSLLLAWRRS
jgi:hypothetical protein